MKTLLITGFDPFGGSDSNPAWLAVEQLPERVGPYKLCKLQLPTVFAEAARLAIEAAQECRPDVILSVGMAAGRAALTPERIAVNIRDARIPDNRGQQPQGAYVDPQGPAAYFATVPVEAMAAAIRRAQLPGLVSNSAGAFVCNDLMYSLLHHFHGTSTRVGFIHIPALPGQHPTALPLEQSVAGLTAAILACQA